VPEPLLKTTLLDTIHARRARVAVIGLGNVGLPLAVAVARAGHNVIGVDPDTERVTAINEGRSHIGDVADAALADLVRAGQLSATSSYARAQGADVAVIAVPTPIDRHRMPDLSYVRAAAESIAAVIERGSLVILESTTYPGTTEEFVAPALEERGLQPGQDVFVGYSPERIDPGNGRYTITNTCKVAAGLTGDCRDLTAAFYASFVEEVFVVSSLKTAEMTKLFENIFRVANIALANEFQVICDKFGIDVWEVIDACSTKPYGFMPFYPGPGLGGHCLPIDPLYLAWKAREVHAQTEFIELASRINAGVPEYVVSKVLRALNAKRLALSGSRVAVLGVAYKKNTSDVREAPAIPIIEQLQAGGAVVSYHDPHVPQLGQCAGELRSQPLSADYLADQDCTLIVADHDDIDWLLVLRHAETVVDTRNALQRLVPFTGQLRDRRASREVAQAQSSEEGRDRSMPTWVLRHTRGAEHFTEPAC
jgi:UDP-N-acetyl-D-glucosamine dehydrogenase